MQKGLGLGIAAMVAMLMITLDSKTALFGAVTGMELCLRMVIPGLFPFLLLSQWLNRALSGRSFLSKCFGLPQGCEGISVSAFMGGYPVGAKAVGTAYRQGIITKDQGETLLAFCNQSGPSFIFGVAAAMFSSRWAAWALWGIQILSAWLVHLVFPISKSDPADRRSACPVIVDPMASAVRTMGIICGWIILFRILLSFLDRWVLWLLPETLNVIVYGLLELSNGCCLLGRIPQEGLRFVVCSGLLSAGGLCVMMQTASVAEGLGLRHLFAGKVIQVLISLTMACLFLPLL